MNPPAASSEIKHTAPSSSDSRERFVEQLVQHHDRIFGYIFSLLSNRQDAEDVFQRTSLILWRKFDEFDTEGSFSAWACGVAFFEVRNFLRVAGRDRLRFSEEILQTLADKRLNTEQRSQHRRLALVECLKRLGEHDRELITQVYEEDQSIKDLAAQRGRAVQTVYNRLHRIRRRLLECVDRRLGEGPRS